MENASCPSCDMALSDYMVFCPRCGAQLRQTKSVQVKPMNWILVVAISIAILIAFIATINAIVPKTTDGKSIRSINPYVGTWTNTYSSSSTFSFNEDGTGCAYGFLFDYKTFTWHGENNRVLIDGWKQDDDFHVPILTPDGNALMFGGSAYYKQKE